jgi:hypothetical protein
MPQRLPASAADAGIYARARTLSASSAVTLMFVTRYKNRSIKVVDATSSTYGPAVNDACVVKFVTERGTRMSLVRRFPPYGDVRRRLRKYSACKFLNVYR